MRTVLALLAALLGACSAPTGKPPLQVAPTVKPDLSVAQQFADAMGHRETLAASLAADPLPAQVLTDGACSVAVAGHLGAAQTRDGSWIVQVPASGATIVAHSGGAMLNVRGANTVDVHTATLALPLAVVPCDALVCAVPGSGRGAYWDVPGRSGCTEMMAVVFVPYAVSSDLLRPPAVGDSWLVRYMRSLPIPEAAVRIDRLPSVVDVQALPVQWSSWGAGEPTIPYLTGLLRRFGGDCYDGWSTDTRTPDQQHPGYGSYYASIVSQAMVQLCSSADIEAKRTLALAVVQRGLDLVGAFADGRRQIVLGGHCAGRKALIVACGHLLGIEALADPTAVVGPVFQEDGCYRPGQWWFGGDWKATWQYRIEPVSRTLSDPPATWGSPTGTHDTLGWMAAGYMPQVVGAQVGTALAMRLMGRTREWGTAADAMVAQWMVGPAAEAKAQLVAAGIALPWGTDYALVCGGGFCAAAWRGYSAVSPSR